MMKTGSRFAHILENSSGKFIIGIETSLEYSMLNWRVGSPGLLYGTFGDCLIAELNFFGKI